MQIGPVYIDFTLPNMDLSTMPPATMSLELKVAFTLVLVLIIAALAWIMAWDHIESRRNNSG